MRADDPNLPDLRRIAEALADSPFRDEVQALMKVLKTKAEE